MLLFKSEFALSNQCLVHILTFTDIMDKKLQYEFQRLYQVMEIKAEFIYKEGLDYLVVEHNALR